MRILIAHDVPSKHVGGMNRIMHFTHDPLVGHGYEIDYFAAEQVSPCNSIVRRFLFPWRVYETALEAFRRGKPYDIVNVHEVQSACIALLKRRAGNPFVVITAHGSEHRSWDLALEEARLGRIGPSLKTRILNPTTRLCQMRLGLSHADQVFCVSEQDRDYFAQRFGIARDKLIRFWSGATDTYFVADPQRLARRVTRLVFSGTWRKNKGIEDLVPAFSILAARHPELSLTILGGSVPVETIRREFSADIAQRVQAIDTHGDDENLQQLLAADIFLLPSLLEGTPLTMMEALAGALPVVTTATSGMKDVIRDGDNGLLVPVRDPQAIVAAVERLISDAKLRIALATRAQQDVKANHTWEASSQKVLAAYESLRAERRSTAKEPARAGHGPNI
jgi:glycosyltransferase involved in cell wall biosynthesis